MDAQRPPPAPTLTIENILAGWGNYRVSLSIEDGDVQIDIANKEGVNLTRLYACFGVYDVTVSGYLMGNKTQTTPDFVFTIPL